MIEEQVLFHGSYLVVEHPDDKHNRNNVDFGKGFYLTGMHGQAEIWAVRKYNQALRTGIRDAQPVINRYILDRELVISKFKTKYFSGTSDEWLDFVARNRNGEKHDYKMVEGPISDDKIYLFVSDFLIGNITREHFHRLAAFTKESHQIMLREDALECLKFIGYEILEV